MLLLYRLARDRRVRVPLVFVDSPLARQAADVTFRHLDALDELAAEFHAQAHARKLPFTLRYTESVEDSMFLNSIANGAIIIAASGMCEAGRIRHHLRHHLGRRQSGILFTGYQAAGTLGRKIVDARRACACSARRSRCRPACTRWAAVGACGAGLADAVAARRAPPRDRRNPARCSSCTANPKPRTRCRRGWRAS